MLRRLFILLLFVTVGVAALTWLFATRPVELKTSPLEFEITAGVGLRGASRRMVEAGVGMAAWQFTWLGRIMGKATDIKAGSYEVESGVTPWRLLQKLTRGDVSQGELAIIEGKTFAEFRRLLDSHPDVRHESADLSDTDLLVKLGIDAVHPEGLFFPDTYLFSKNTPDFAIYRRAHQALLRHLDAEWKSRAADLPYRNPYEALIMASIVEKETGNPRDREHIAAVFVNRLRNGMLLQTDPSVIYGLRGFDGNLRKRDLVADSLYNTYLRPGLPPTPIALPGRASLHAALHPAASDKYYFVSRGDGSSEFSRTLDEHNRAVARYQKRTGDGQ